MKYLVDDDEKIKEIGKIRKKISNLEEKLNKRPDFEKSQIYLELKELNSELKKICQNLSILKKEFYNETRKSAFCEEIHYFEKYLLSIEGNFLMHIDLAKLEYEYFYGENLSFPSQYKEKMLNLTDDFEARLNLIKNNLKKSIDYIKDLINIEQQSHIDLFEFYNILGDLHLQIFLIIKEHSGIESEIANSNLKNSLTCYKIAKDCYDKSPLTDREEKKYLKIQCLPLIEPFFENIKGFNFLNVKSKINRVEDFKNSLKN